ncbi:ABC transporter substrate-binding protein [Gordonia paraffinivorans]|uniref:ABC transporter substrate-binding protein n=1 Tax=Gordonia paraffinivorans TaxID=175628 RepID=UPI0014464C49|nr:ABC transporter substrate-binding protein [Gordonia paraffinivorans]
MKSQEVSSRVWVLIRTLMIIGLVAGLATACGSANSATTAGSGETITITDELGRQVEVATPIKAVYPDLWYQAELVRALGAADTITAVDTTVNPDKNPNNVEYFADFQGLPDVGHYEQPNWEAIVSSGAEVALMRRNGPWQEAIKKLEPFGIKVVVVTGWDPVVTRKFLPQLGQLFGKEKEAQDLTDLFDDIDGTLKEKLDGVAPRTAYFENNADFITSVEGSGWHDALVEGGTANIFGDVKADSSSAAVHQFEVDPVEIIGRNPSVIIHNGVDGQTSGYQPWTREQMAEQARKIAGRSGWQSIDAVRTKDIYVFNNFFYSALGKKFGALAVAKWAHPEQFADVDLDTYFDRWLASQGVEPRTVGDYYHKYEG